MDAAGISADQLRVNGDLRWYFPGERLEIRHVPLVMRFRWPGTGCSISRYYSNGSSHAKKILVSFDESDGAVFSAPGRGKWVSERVTVSFRDILGIFKSDTVIASADEFMVYPSPAEDVPLSAASGGGETGRNARTWRRTDTFLDSRAYIRGDDPRRINWKQYARHGTLFVRVGEFHMPPEAAVTVILDPAPFETAREWLKDAWTERLVSACAAFCQGAMESGRDVYLSVNGMKPLKMGGLSAQESLALAVFAPGQAVRLPEPVSGSALVLFGSVGNESTKRIAATLRGNAEASVYLAGPPGDGSGEGNAESRFAAFLDAVSRFLFSGTEGKERGREYRAARADMILMECALRKAGATHVEIV